MDGLPDWLKRLIPTGPNAAGNPVVTAANVTQSLDRPGVTEFELKGQYLHIGTPKPGDKVAPVAPDVFLGELFTQADIDASSAFHHTIGTGNGRVAAWNEHAGDFTSHHAVSHISDGYAVSHISDGSATTRHREDTRGSALDDLLDANLPTTAWCPETVARLGALLAKALPCVPWVNVKTDLSLFVDRETVGAEIRHAPRRSVKVAVGPDGAVRFWAVGNTVPLVDGWRDETNPVAASDNFADIVGALSTVVSSIFYDAEESDDAEALFVPRRLARDLPWAKAGDVVWLNPRRSTMFGPDAIWRETARDDPDNFTNWPEVGPGSFRPPEARP